MNKSKTFEQHIGDTVENVLLLGIKNTLSLRVVQKRFAALLQGLHLATSRWLRLAPSGKSVFETTQVGK